jgi:hypothetical protein
VTGAQDFPRIDPEHPATFRERGVAVPFTTPKLAGGRVRDSERHGLELVVPNPSGGRGIYVVALSKVRERYRPTVHDVLLLQRIAGLSAVNPTSVRGVAWTLASEGHAGPKARDAAEVAARIDRSEILAAKFVLMKALIEKVDPGGHPITSIAQTADLERRGRAALCRIGPVLGRSEADLGQALAALAVVFAPVGAAWEDGQSRIVRLIDRIHDTRESIGSLCGSPEAADSFYLARSVTEAMDVVIPCAHGLVRASRALVADPLMLLSRWIADPAKVSAFVGRAEWVLDGWEQICLIWQLAPNNQRRWAALLEMVQLVPFLPLETSEWSLRPLPIDALAPATRITCQSDDWRGGAIGIALTTRNETIRAMAF